MKEIQEEEGADFWKLSFSSFANKIPVRALLSTYYVFCAEVGDLGSQGIPGCSSGEGCLPHKQPKGAPSAKNDCDSDLPLLGSGASSSGTDLWEELSPYLINGVFRHSIYFYISLRLTRHLPSASAG